MFLLFFAFQLLTNINGSDGNSVFKRDATITINCGSTTTQITTPETTITSPNYPNSYPNNQDCKTVIQFSQGQRISVEFLNFDIESHNRCAWDWLEIRDGSSSSANPLGSKMCGNQLPGPITSTGNSLHIHFHTDNSVVKSGFQLKVKIADTASLTTTTTAGPPSGTCTGGSFNFDDYLSTQTYMDYLSCLSTTYPDRAQIVSIGSSIEGREIRLIKIGKPRPDGITKPAIWIDGGIHAREWISPASIGYMIHSLVESYNRPEVRNLVDTFDIYVVPVLNPDGYEYSRTNDRYWRKNRRINGGSSCVGVDLNRNWGYQWGGEGSSNNPCSQIYRGTGPFSEPETAAVRDFINAQKQNQEFLLFLTYHSYGQYVLHTWGYRRGTPPNEAELREMGNIAAQAMQGVNGNSYSVGGAADLLYAAAGGSDDWAQGGAGIRYSFTMELPDRGNQGFVLSKEQILPVGREVFAGVAAMMNKLIEITDIPTTAAPEVTTTTTPTTTAAPTTTATPAQPTTTTVVEQTTTTTFSPNTTCNGNPSTDWSCCNYNEPCTEGGGDCDHDSDCIRALKCGNNNCQVDFSSPGSNWSPSADCCYDPSRDCRGNPSTDWNCCSDAFPCLEGQGDCDEDSQCEGNLVCGPDNCLRDFSTSSSNWLTGADCCTSDSTTDAPTETTTDTVVVTTTLSGSAPNVTIDCSSPFDEVTTPGTSIMSPNYPNNYGNGQDCQVTIRFTGSPSVLIEFDPLYNIESHSRCSYDYLEVRDGPSATSSLIGSKHCGATAPAPIQSTGNSMTLIFHTDSSVQRTGFKIVANPVGTPASTPSPPATTTLLPPATTSSGPTINPPTTGCGIRPSRIVGGSEASPYSLPWQVGLVTPGSQRPFCGGTLIGPRHVLTAAHCTGVNGGNWGVMVGEHRTTDSSDGTRHTKCRHVNHPLYRSINSIDHDFAIVHLDNPVQFGARAVPACLPTSASHGGGFLDDKTLTVSGWGSLCSGCSSPNVLHVVDVPGVSNAVCNQQYEGRYGPGSITADMMCAGDAVNGGIDACQGDSGGPLTYNDQGRATLVGVVSWGHGCAVPNYAGVYSRVTEALTWINEQLSQTC